jgi:hypothetical protein
MVDCEPIQLFIVDFAHNTQLNAKPIAKQAFFPLILPAILADYPYGYAIFGRSCLQRADLQLIAKRNIDTGKIIR